MRIMSLAILIMASMSAAAEQKTYTHNAILEYQEIRDGCQMYRLNTPEGATLLIGHNFNSSGPNAEGPAAAGTLSMLSAMYSDSSYRSFSMRGTNSLYQPIQNDSYEFVKIGVDRYSSPNNYMLSQSNFVERPVPYYSEGTELSMRFYNEDDQPRYTGFMPPYLSLCGNSIASFESITSHRIQVATSISSIKVQYTSFNPLEELKASNDLVGEVQLSWRNSDNSESKDRKHKYTQISRAEKNDGKQEPKFIEIAKVDVGDDRYIDINSDKNIIVPGKQYIYKVKYCDGYNFCESNNVSVTGQAN